LSVHGRIGERACEVPKKSKEVTRDAEMCEREGMR
jgi:hypothetical protein